MTIKKKMGRPPLPRGEAKTENLQIRLTKAEREAIDAKAKASGKDVSEWARERIILPSNTLEDIG